MKKFIFCVSIVLVAGVFAFGQNKNTERKSDPNSVETLDPKPAGETKSGTPVTAADDKMDDALLSAGTSLEAQLQSTLDVKKSKVGDEVVFKTTKTIKENGEVLVPKGTKLIGRVTEVQRKTKENAGSKIGVVFETIEGKNLSAPFSASIVSITNVANNVAVGDLFSSNTSGSATSSGSASSGGGLLGGTGGLVGGATQTVGGVLNSTTQTVGGVTNTAGQTVGGVSNSVGGTLRGLQINQSASGSANSSTTLSSQDKNLKIDKGANFQLELTKPVEN